jgi:hypothetical protein
VVERVGLRDAVAAAADLDASSAFCVDVGRLGREQIGSPGPISALSNLPKSSGAVGGSSPSSAACSA